MAKGSLPTMEWANTVVAAVTGGNLGGMVVEELARAVHMVTENQALLAKNFEEFKNGIKGGLGTNAAFQVATATHNTVNAVPTGMGNLPDNGKNEIG